MTSQLPDSGSEASRDGARRLLSPQTSRFQPFLSVRTSANRVWSAAACFKIALACVVWPATSAAPILPPCRPPARHPQPCLPIAQLGLAGIFVRARASPQ